ncbi:MAG: AAA-like domain-containing protein [Blastocatellia bacterium]
MLPAAARLPELRTLIDQQAYFVIHAPRQLGKTTMMTELAKDLTAEGRYAAVLLSMETGEAFNDDPIAAETEILRDWKRALPFRLPNALQPSQPIDPELMKRLGVALSHLSQHIPRPLVAFLDEIDALKDQALISVLRQLRSGYSDRPSGFPWALALIGLRDVRDYKVASGGSERLHTASPFNIKMESLRLRNFSAEDIAKLYRQHTAETGQVFTEDSIARAFELTQGFPWLVNALARQAVEFLQTDRDKPITLEIIEQAKEKLIERRDTHIDSLAERLRETRVRRIIEPMLAGDLLGDVPDDDRRFLIDLGLMRAANGAALEIANPIYREIIPRYLTSGTLDTLPRIQPTWLDADGSLNPDKMLEAFLKFWRQHGQPLLKSVHYHEIAPHIVLMAFLDRVVNGGGSLEREYAIGTRRMDIRLKYGSLVMGIELKVWRDGESDPLDEGLEQLDEYLSGLSLQTGWLVIFDQRTGAPNISERTNAEKARTPAGREIIVIRA